MKQEKQPATASGAKGEGVSWCDGSSMGKRGDGDSAVKRMLGARVQAKGVLLLVRRTNMVPFLERREDLATAAFNGGDLTNECEGFMGGPIGLMRAGN
ncbi:hypothetical protein U1Q18_002418 [Sarracenia purpurea var. burkii]